MSKIKTDTPLGFISLIDSDCVHIMTRYICALTKGINAISRCWKSGNNNAVAL